MIDKLEKVNIHDFILAKALNIDAREVEKSSLIIMKNEMHNKAFSMRDNKETITQEKADELNDRLQEIIYSLMTYDYDPMRDYIIDFNSFVKDNEAYGRFCW